VGCTKPRSETIAAMAAGRIGDADARELLDHLERCDACSEEFDAVADVVAGLEHDAEGNVAGRGVSSTAAGGRDGEATPSDLRDGEPRPASPWPRRALAGLAAIAASIALFFLVRPLVTETRPPETRGRTSHLASLDPVPASKATLRSGSLPAEQAALFERAMERYADRDYTEAARLLRDVVTATAGHDLADLYLGIALLQTRDRAEALEPLSRAARSDAPLLRERASWYLANAHLALGEPDRAIAILEELVAREGDYEWNAADLLAEIREARGR